MITPGYALTATERVLPRLALDFTTASLDSRVTVTRALNTATRVNSSGYIETVNADLPRFDFSPTSVGTCRGLLIEETRANAFLYSAEFNQSSVWTVVGLTIGQNEIQSPDGTVNANKLKETATTDPHTVFQTFNTTNGVTYTLSFFAKAAERTWVRTRGFFGINYFDLSNGTSGTVVSGTTVTITPYGSGWYRITATRTADTTVLNNAQIAPTTGNNVDSYAGVLDSGVYVYGAQVEVGDFATSYIPTTTTSLTRNADVATMTGTNFSDWYVSSSAALAAVVVPSVATGTRPIWQFDDTTTNEIIALRGNVANPELYIVDNGALQAQLDAGTIAANTQYGLCAAFTTNSCAVSQNGATPVTTATATMPTVTQARIGSDGSNFLNGAVRTLRYWPQRILNAETQAFSK